ncbi:hypothetical protein M569_15403, partial [Genlisea aurea]
LIEHAKKFVADKISDMPKPEATVTDVDFKGFSLDGITLLAKVAVSNPYDVAIPICEISYVLKSSDRRVASGNIPDPGSLEGKEKTMLDVTVKVPHSAVVSLIRDIGADWDVDYLLELGLIIDLPLIGNFTIPIAYAGAMKLPTLSDLFGGKSSDEVE